MLKTVSYGPEKQASTHVFSIAWRKILAELTGSGLTFDAWNQAIE